MTLPTHVVGLITTYEVEHKTVKKKNAGEVEHTRKAGAVIRVGANQNPDHCRQTFWHELMHVADYEMDVGLKERQVNRLATWWHHCLKHNPVLARYLCDAANRE